MCFAPYLGYPDNNALVEGYHRTYQQECLAVQRPTNQERTRRATDTFAHHYNWERPHQGLACANRPRHLALPQLPSLHPLPATVNPDA